MCHLCLPCCHGTCCLRAHCTFHDAYHVHKQLWQCMHHLWGVCRRHCLGAACECVATITVSQLQLLLQLLLSSIPHTMPCSPAVLGCAALLVSKARLTHPLQRQRSVNRGQHKQLQQHHAPTPHHTDLIRCIIFNTSSSRSDHNSSSSGHNSCHSGVCPLPAVRLQCTEAAVGCSAACCDGPGHQG